MRTVVFSLFIFMFQWLQAQHAQIYINHRPSPANRYTIIIPKLTDSTEYRAARKFQKYFEKIIGIQLDFARDTAIRTPLEICFGKCKNRKTYATTTSNDPDGFIFGTSEGNLTIAGNSSTGTRNGVYEFLERYAGCRFYAPGVEKVSFQENIKTPDTPFAGIPAFRSREVYYAGLDDADFANKMRCVRNAWKGSEDWGMWVHTMFSLVSPDQYFDQHPEYFALMAGKRGKTQLCLTNPDVLKITIEELRKRMADKPGAKYWSVSQMDTYGYCECPKCKAINQREGSPSGAIITFVNNVAAAFPDKVISTLAYQYSRKAPKFIKPASNVNIMLCTIECDRSKPIASDSSAGSFYADLRDWSKIAKDILVWDYVIQFSNMIAPFPNLHVLQPNIQLFKKFNVTSVFEQGCRGTYSENQELRQYLLAKLLWNPFLNQDSLLDDFYLGYYGNAAKWVKRYNESMQQALIESGKTLWIYGSPVEEVNSFLNSEQIFKYDEIMDQAEYSVSLNPVMLERAKKARLPLRYAKLEIARKTIVGENGIIDLKEGKTEIRKPFLEQLDLFVDQANKAGVKSIHERGLTPDQYKEKVLASLQNAYTQHLAIGKSYKLIHPPSLKYSGDGTGALTDGKRGFDNYHILWQGFEGEDFEMVIDLGEKVEFNHLGAGFLQDITSWIFLPEYVDYSVSDDGKKFTSVGRVKDESNQKEVLPVIRNFETAIPTTSARYLKVFAKSLLKCPEWHIGHGGKAWLFCDEAIVQKRQLP
ncbi:MAG: DUF4838 domain-containing protein [Bacteroidota bacterium]